MTNDHRVIMHDDGGWQQYMDCRLLAAVKGYWLQVTVYWQMAPANYCSVVITFFTCLPCFIL